MACPATVLMWATCKRRSDRACLYEFPVEPVRAWVPNWAHQRLPTETVPDRRFPLRVAVERRWLAQSYPEALAKLEAGAPRRVLARKPLLVVTKESQPAEDLVHAFYAALRDSRLDDGEAGAVLGLTEKQVSALRRGWLRVSSGAELDRVQAALKQELQRQARVSGVATEDGR